MRGESIPDPTDPSSPPIPPDDLVILEQMLTAMRSLTPATQQRRTPWGREGKTDTLDPDPFAEPRAFARRELKGKERAVIEALCAAGGELPIPDLGVNDGVDWDDPFEGFKGVQRRTKDKLKRVGFRLERHANTARLVPSKGRKRG